MAAGLAIRQGYLVQLLRRFNKHWRVNLAFDLWMSTTLIATALMINSTRDAVRN
jgi:hypothetical protein